MKIFQISSTENRTYVCQNFANTTNVDFQKKTLFYFSDFSVINKKGVL